MKFIRFVTVGFGLALWSAFLPTVDSQVIISEFMADNTRTLADQDGDYPDWLEIYNGSRETINLGGWYLTDSATNLTKWRFPNTVLLPNAHLVVFASGKDRTVPGAQLHTDFQLASGGEHLALVKPDGVSVAFSYGSRFPVQVPEVSFGVPIQQTKVSLISSATPAKLLVPADDSPAAGWTDPDWNDSGWMAVGTAIGYEVEGQPPVPILVADSAAEFSGKQGQDNWFYGYYNRSIDSVSGYQIADFTAFPQDNGAPSALNFWNGTTWDWFRGDPPWTEIGQTYTRPNGVNSGQEHWPIRRWVSNVAGTVTVQWKLAKQDPNGKGVTGRVFHHGSQKDIAIIAGDNTEGVIKTIVIPDVKVGDFIDFALSATGLANATDDSADGSFLSATIHVTAGLGSQIQSNVQSAMRNVNATAYLRIPFSVTDPSGFQFLTMKMKYDDGFIAYLNGVEVARRNAPDEPIWNSTALEPRENVDAVQFEEFDLSRSLGLLHVGMNALAIHALNASAGDADFLILPELEAVTGTMEFDSRRYFSLPTPGALNGFGKTNLGALIMSVTPTPAVPMDDQELVVTARVMPTFDAVSKVTLFYRVMFALPEVSIPMVDDGLHGDGAAGDTTYGAIIPASASAPGQMVRYYVTATDSSGDLTRSPPYLEARNSPQYWGTIVADPSLTNALPVLHWFVQTPSAAETSTGTRCSIYFQGEFYDNVGVNIHGQSSSTFPKKSYNFDLNTGHHFRYAADQRKVEDFNLLTTYPDKSHMRNMLAYETYRDAGSPHHIAFALRLQRNGVFFSDTHFVEDGDEDYLARVGLNPSGALYKMYNILDSATSGAEKKTRKNENNADLQALISGSRRTGVQRTQYLFDNINIPAMANFLAAMIITGGTDCCHKNYYAYRDSTGSGEWQYLPWDVDLTFGRNWNSANAYFDDEMFPRNQLYIGSNNNLVSALFATPSFKQMYLRRVRTLMEDLMQWTNTPPQNLKYERRIAELATLIAPDAALDYAKWPTWGKKQTLPQAVEIMRKYLTDRRTNLFQAFREIPASQPTNARLAFGAIDFFPASGKQDEEYIQLINTNSYAVDLSNWKLAGAVAHTFQPGVVLPTNSSVYLSPNVVAFRARTNGPRGAQGLFVQGNYRSQLSARGGSLRLLDGAREAAATTYTGTPTLMQQNLRITEIMYHPANPPAGSPFLAEDFEYIQLKNIGGVTLDLTGVHFTNGISFNFTAGAAASLPPGHVVYVVKNLDAFTSRYGMGANVAGVYTGNLDNSGENLRLDDASGETVLDFPYNNSWHNATDGAGFSLMIVQDGADWQTWKDRASWTAGSILHGTPAEAPTLSSWQARYFVQDELKNPAIGGASADPDGDRLSNQQEFISGTDPRNAQSHLWLESAMVGQGAAGGNKLRFEAVAGRSYTVQYCDRLAGDRAWLKVQDVPKQPLTRAVEVSDGSIKEASATRYYRVVTPQQP
jgi:hypothetical protein